MQNYTVRVILSPLAFYTTESMAHDDMISALLALDAYLPCGQEKAWAELRSWKLTHVKIQTQLSSSRKGRLETLLPTISNEMVSFCCHATLTTKCLVTVGRTDGRAGGRPNKRSTDELGALQWRKPRL